MAADYGRIVKDGLWDNNGVLAMLLGMCPTMAMTTSATNGLGMGLATAVVMAASGALVAGFRQYITQEVRIPVYILIVAAMVTLVDLTMNAFMRMVANCPRDGDEKRPCRVGCSDLLYMFQGAPFTEKYRDD